MQKNHSVLSESSNLIFSGQIYIRLLSCPGLQIHFTPTVYLEDDHIFSGCKRNANWGDGTINIFTFFFFLRSVRCPISVLNTVSADMEKRSYNTYVHNHTISCSASLRSWYFDAETYISTGYRMYFNQFSSVKFKI